MKGTFQYLEGTAYYSLCNSESNLLIKRYTTADWANDWYNRILTFVILLLNGVAIFLERLRNNLALCCLCVCSTKDVSLQRFFEHLKIAKDSKDLRPLYCDNLVAIVCTKDPKYHNKVKYNDIKYNFVRDIIISGKWIYNRFDLWNDNWSFYQEISRDLFEKHV